MVYSTAFATMAVAFWCVGFGVPAVRVLAGETVDVQLFDRPYVATRGSPGPLLGMGAVFTFFTALFVAPTLILWRVQRRGPIAWEATDRGLVRVQAGRTSVVPWSHFTNVMVSERKDGRGNISLWSRSFGLDWRPGFGGEGPYVWTMSRVLTLSEVESAQTLGDLIREKLPKR